MRTAFAASVIVLLFLLIPLPAHSQNQEMRLSDIRKPQYELTGEQSFNNYTVRTFFNSNEESFYDENSVMGYVEILRGNTTIFKQRNHKFRIGLLYDDSDFKEYFPGQNIGNDLIKMGKDITGKGIPNLVVTEFTGGAHCCTKVHVFEIGKEFRKIAEIDATHNDTVHFEDPDGSGKLVLVTYDFVFAYWKTGFATSPAPKIILRYRDDGYRPALDLMKSPPPGNVEYNERLKEVKKDLAEARNNQIKGRPGQARDNAAPPEDTDIPPSLWAYMLDLIYTGNGDMAWKFYDDAWPEWRKGKKEFLAEFKARLAESSYWPGVKELNRW